MTDKPQHEDQSQPTLIYSYTRAQALADGVLVDVTETARELGYRYPVAVTARFWHEWIAVDQVAEAEGQDVQGRLWDTLSMLRYSILQQPNGADVSFSVLFVQPGGTSRSVSLRSICGPNDDGTPCLTVLMPDED